MSLVQKFSHRWYQFCTKNWKNLKNLKKFENFRTKIFPSIVPILYEKLKKFEKIWKFSYKNFPIDGTNFVRKNLKNLRKKMFTQNDKKFHLILKTICNWYQFRTKILLSMVLVLYENWKRSWTWFQKTVRVLYFIVNFFLYKKIWEEFFKKRII